MGWGAAKQTPQPESQQLASQPHSITPRRRACATDIITVEKNYMQRVTATYVALGAYTYSGMSALATGSLAGSATACATNCDQALAIRGSSCAQCVVLHSRWCRWEVVEVASGELSACSIPCQRTSSMDTNDPQLDNNYAFIWSLCTTVAHMGVRGAFCCVRS